MKSRWSILATSLRFAAQNLADDIYEHDMTEDEVRNLCADLADEALHYANEMRAEDKAEALRAAREERRAAV